MVFLFRLDSTPIIKFCRSNGGPMNTSVIFVFKLFRVVFALALTFALIAPLGYPNQRARASGPYVVNVTYDGPDSNLLDGGICYDGVSGCPLRAAIQQASYDGVATNITFDSSLAGLTLYLSDTYGSLIVSGSSITINGDTGSGNYPPLINGSNLTGSKNIFEIQGNSNMISNLVVRDGPANGIRIYDSSGSGFGSYNTLDYLHIYGNANNGIAILGDAGGGGHDNTIQHSLIGAANWAQTTCPGDGNGWDGILIAGGADNTNINSNNIVCNGNSGIYMYGGVGGQISGTMIQTNKIGTDGVNDMGNGLSGIADWQATGDTIYNNLISGNGNDGIWLSGSTNATITTNHIGVNQFADTAIPNGYSGITISDGATGNSVGSPTDANARNILSGNSRCGVEILNGATNNVLDGNYIGLGSGGMTVIPNGLAGVAFDGVSNNALSTSTATVKQFISGNTREGVWAYNSNTIMVNSATYIGVAGNTITPAGNGMEGIMLNESGGAYIVPAKIMYNGKAGIAVVGNSATGNKFIPGTIGSNVGLPIDLGNDGHTANGSQTPPGPNNWQNYPSETTPTGTSISGISCAGCYIYVYTPIGNPIANNGGGNYLTSITADGTTGAFSYTLPPSLEGVTLIARHPTSGNCSEMSDIYYKTNHHIIFLPILVRN